jgi:hypothetical protein
MGCALPCQCQNLLFCWGYPGFCIPIPWSAFLLNCCPHRQRCTCASVITILLQQVPSSNWRNKKYLIRMRLTTCASLHGNVTRIQPSHVSLRCSIEGSHICPSWHSSWHPHHGLLHLSHGSWHRLTSWRGIPRWLKYRDLLHYTVPVTRFHMDTVLHLTRSFGSFKFRLTGWFGWRLVVPSNSVVVSTGRTGYCTIFSPGWDDRSTNQNGILVRRMKHSFTSYMKFYAKHLRVIKHVDVRKKSISMSKWKSN